MIIFFFAKGSLDDLQINSQIFGFSIKSWVLWSWQNHDTAFSSDHCIIGCPSTIDSCVSRTNSRSWMRSDNWVRNVSGACELSLAYDLKNLLNQWAILKFGRENSRFRTLLAAQLNAAAGESLYLGPKPTDPQDGMEDETSTMDRSAQERLI